MNVVRYLDKRPTKILWEAVKRNLFLEMMSSLDKWVFFSKSQTTELVKLALT